MKNNIKIEANAVIHKEALDTYKKMEFEDCRYNINVGIQIAAKTKNINTEKFKPWEILNVVMKLNSLKQPWFEI